MKRAPSHTLGGLAVLLVSACAIAPWQPDPAARAPDLAGFGRVDMPTSNRSAAAQRWYVQGVLQAYAFNEVEAVRMFKAALAQDPRCAVCAWGVAWQLGPNINDTSRARVPQALPYLDLALQNAATATPRERAPVAVELVVGEAQALSQWGAAEFTYGAEGVRRRQQ